MSQDARKFEFFSVVNIYVIELETELNHLLRSAAGVVDVMLWRCGWIFEFESGLLSSTHTGHLQICVLIFTRSLRKEVIDRLSYVRVCNVLPHQLFVCI